MRKLSILPVLALAAVATAGLAFASNDERRADVPRDQWLTIAQITEKLSAQGYDVRKVEIDDGAYEVEAIDAEGRRLEAYLDPATGEPLNGEAED